MTRTTTTAIVAIPSTQAVDTVMLRLMLAAAIPSIAQMIATA